MLKKLRRALRLSFKLRTSSLGKENACLLASTTNNKSREVVAKEDQLVSRKVRLQRPHEIKSKYDSAIDLDVEFECEDDIQDLLKIDSDSSTTLTPSEREVAAEVVTENTAASAKKSVRFSDPLFVDYFTTYSSDEYDRVFKMDRIDWRHAMLIRQELNEFKREMVVHPEADKFTHFFY